MTTLRDQLNVLAESVTVPPTPTVLDLERGARHRRPLDPRWLVAAAAAAALVASGTIAWLGQRDDGNVEPVGPPTWSDVDVPWTADGVLHWRDAAVTVDPLTAYGQGRDVLWLLKDGVLTEVEPDGATRQVADGVVGPLAVDPDGTWVAWSDGHALRGFDAADATEWSEAGHENVLVTALSGTHLDGIGPEGGIAVTLGAATATPPGQQTPTVLDRRAGWRVETVGDQARVRAVHEGAVIDLPRSSLVVGIGPGAGVIAAVTPADAVVVIDPTTGSTTPLGVPAGSSLADAGYRWTQDGGLVMPVTPDPSAADPLVSWYLCSPPGWGCEPMGVPDQHRSEIPILATAWNFALARGESSGGASASVSVESAPAQP